MIKDIHSSRIRSAAAAILIILYSRVVARLLYYIIYSLTINRKPVERRAVIWRYPQRTNNINLHTCVFNA